MNIGVFILWVVFNVGLLVCAVIKAIKYGLFIMILSGIVVFVTADIIPKFFSNDPYVLDYGTRYLKISAFILPAYPIFFLSNGFFMALKKSENAMINNLLRNVLVPIFVFHIARHLSADFDTFFWIWAIFQWTLSLLLLIFVIYYMKYRLKKSSTITNPRTQMFRKRSSNK